MGVGDGEMDSIDYQINQDFVAPDATPQDIQAMVAGFVQGSIPISDYVRYMQRIGRFDGERSAEEYADMLETGGLPNAG